METITALTQMSSAWLGAGLFAAQMAANYLGGRKEKKAQAKTDAMNDARRMEEWEATMRMEDANTVATDRRDAAIAAAGERGYSGRRDAFDMMKGADEEEAGARDALSKAINDFGIKTKEAKLAQAKEKRTGRVAKAIGGTNIKGSKGAGRAGISEAITTAIAEGKESASNTSQMAASLGAYGADMNREFNEYGQLAADNTARGNFAKWGRETARQRESAASRDQARFESAANRGYSGMIDANRKIGPRFMTPDPTRRVYPGAELENAISSGISAYNSAGRPKLW